MPTLNTYNLRAWIDDHRSLLKPPVGLLPVWPHGDHQFMVSVVGGPNQRKDYHINPTEEFFFQIEGGMTLKIIENGQRRDVAIGEGEVFLLPPNVPHSPQRPANTVGLLIEHQRPEGHDDHVRFYCESCDDVLFDEQVHMTDLSQLKPILDKFWADTKAQTCKKCGAVLAPPTQ